MEDDKNLHDFSNSVMIALLPIETSWCKIALPHMTLVYAGEINDLPIASLNELLKDASALAITNRPIALEVTGEDLFGEEDDVSVMTLRPNPQLLSMRHFVERWNRSKHPFSPHVTVGGREDRVDPLPSVLAFDRIYVSWGGENNLTFNMRQ